MSGFKKAYSVVGVVLLVELALQFYLIAAAALAVWGAKDNATDVYSAFKVGDQFAALHAVVGTFVIPLTILILIALSFGARLPARTKGQTAGLLGLMVVQFLLGVVGSGGGTGLAVIGGLHGLTALVIVGLAGSLVFRNWAFGVGRANPPLGVGSA
ncbi:MAG TPA: DUF6220 domain-containing protein [Candidatus Micrarchaeaceae archaeon]|nr:DUF6220 domain-containing protein [Candidatus Micrarchaeaceae archaeon]